MNPVLVNITLQKHFITIIYPVAQQHGGGGGGVSGRSHTLTDIIVIDQSHRYVYVTSGASDQPEPFMGVHVPVRRCSWRAWL